MPKSLLTAGILVLPPFADDSGTRTITRQALVALWAEILGIAPKDVATDRDLSEFGATALDSVRVAARLRDGYGLTVGPNDLAANPTVEAQLKLLRQRSWTGQRRGTLQ